jgi:tRNA G10  N-methylase Trm11
MQVGAASGPKYLIYFAHAHTEFRMAEFDSLLKLQGIEPSTVYDSSAVDLSSPFMTVTLPSFEVADQIGARAVLIKAIYELWGAGTNYSEVVDAVKSLSASIKVHTPQFLFAHLFITHQPAHSQYTGAILRGECQLVHLLGGLRQEL